MAGKANSSFFSEVALRISGAVYARNSGSFCQKDNFNAEDITAQSEEIN